MKFYSCNDFMHFTLCFTLQTTVMNFALRMLHLLGYNFRHELWPSKERLVLPVMLEESCYDLGLCATSHWLCQVEMFAQGLQLSSLKQVQNSWRIFQITLCVLHKQGWVYHLSRTVRWLKERRVCTIIKRANSNDEPWCLKQLYYGLGLHVLTSSELLKYQCTSVVMQATRTKRCDSQPVNRTLSGYKTWCKCLANFRTERYWVRIYSAFLP